MHAEAVFRLALLIFDGNAHHAARDIFRELDNSVLREIKVNAVGILQSVQLRRRYFGTCPKSDLWLVSGNQVKIDISADIAADSLGYRVCSAGNRAVPVVVHERHHSR